MTQERSRPGSLRESQRRSANEMGERARELLKEAKQLIVEARREINKSQGKAGLFQRINLKLQLTTAIWMYKMQRWASKSALKIEEKYG